jgi:Ca2+-binding RTX toxin-like protein
MNSYYHRINIVNDGFREIGIGIEVGGRVAITQDFARSGTGSFLTGVAFDDNDGDRFYDPGEGIGSLSISITGSSGTYTTTTMASGGYQYKLAAGTYTVTFSGEGIATTKHQVTVGTKNVKLDLIDPATGENQPVPSDPGPVFGNLIEGTPGVDALYGSSAADTINGREGNDALHGKGDNDFLYGGTGDDKISGGKGTDQLIGGDGADMFVFAGGSGTDTITDFEGGADKIRLNLTSLGLASTADAQSHASRVGDDLVYNFDSGDVIVLQDYYIF